LLEIETEESERVGHLHSIIERILEEKNELEESYTREAREKQ
jgi:hypothetical protein